MGKNGFYQAEFKNIFRIKIVYELSIGRLSFFSTVGGTRVGFLEVTGLTTSTQVLEYREGSSPEMSVTKMPGKIEYANIILERGIMQGDNDF